MEYTFSQPVAFPNVPFWFRLGLCKTQDGKGTTTNSGTLLVQNLDYNEGRRGLGVVLEDGNAEFSQTLLQVRFPAQIGSSITERYDTPYTIIDRNQARSSFKVTFTDLDYGLKIIPDDLKQAEPDCLQFITFEYQFTDAETHLPGYTIN